jgi:uncharacterized membrane protein YuzA (DUF378 family)
MDMNYFKSVFAYIIYAVIGFVTLIAVLSIWDVVAWSMVREYFWKSISSLLALAIGAVAVYVVYSILNKPEEKKSDKSN